MERRGRSVLALGYLILVVGVGWILKFTIYDVQTFDATDLWKYDTSAVEPALEQSTLEEFRPIPLHQHLEAIRLIKGNCARTIRDGIWRKERKQVIWAGAIMFLGALVIHLGSNRKGSPTTPPTVP